MELNVYSILDLKTQAFSRPFYATTRGEAIRSFSDAVNDPRPENMFNKWPGDYELYEIGTWDDKSCTYTQEQKQNIGLASQFKRVEDKGQTTNY